MIPVCEPCLNGNELEYVNDAVQTGWISSSGKYVKAFEEAFADYCGVKYAVGVCNGTVALHLALSCLGIGKGDEVIIPDFTMISSAFSVCYTGAMPVFVDADKNTWDIDSSKIEEKIKPQTKAIMPVHIFGNPCKMDAIQQIASRHNLFIIEDAAQAHGAQYLEKKTGNLSDIAAFSFFANKNLTTGEGGMVVTNDDNFYKKALYDKNLCFDLDAPRNYTHNDIGFNYRMSNIHAAIGLAQTEKADEYKKRRMHNGKLYRNYLKDIKGIILQEKQADAENVFWMNGILLNPALYGRSRDQLIEHLKKKGVDTRLFFVGMHRQPSLLKFGCDCSGCYPVTDNLTENGLYLPSGSNLSKNKIRYICDVIKQFQKD
ncbi:MAG: aminotransferase DegT [Desulfobacteraceae bacterium 4572_187]|nr:MAG: aminotransferase DegT [Desulfobacteraceae bacterium 4572_187]